MSLTQASRIIGLTGNIGSGKSSVAQLLAAKGAAVIDADVLAKEATQDKQILGRIAEQLGEHLIRDQQLDRQATAKLIFDNPAARLTLNSIIHPWVRQKRDALIAHYQSLNPPPPVIVLDIPLLYEVAMDRELETVVVVNASLKTRTARVVARSGLSEAEVQARDDAQIPLADKVSKAHFVIDNEGPYEALEQQVEKLWQYLTNKEGGELNSPP